MDKEFENELNEPTGDAEKAEDDAEVEAEVIEPVEAETEAEAETEVSEVAGAVDDVSQNELTEDEFVPLEEVLAEMLPFENKRMSKKKLTLIISLTAIYAVAAGIIIGILLSFLYSGGKSAQYKPIGLNTAVTDTEGLGVQAKDAIAKAYDSVVVINVTKLDAKAVATGVVLTEDGYIATNQHVIEGAVSISVTFYDGVTVSATLRGESEADDLAVIKVERDGLVPAEFVSNQSAYVGQDIYVIGTPVSNDFRWTATKGIISYVDREIKIYEDDGTLQKKLKLLQTDAVLNPGNSGGPVINSAGQVLGIVNMKLAGETVGIGFAIPSDGALEILNAIIRDGNADSVNSTISSKRPLLGIVGVYIQKGLYYINIEMDGQMFIQQLPPEEVDVNDENIIHSEHSGLYVNAVTENTGADGKLKAGDVIVEIEGETVTSRSQLSSIVNEKNVGDTVNIKFYRDGVLHSVDIELSAEK